MSASFLDDIVADKKDLLQAKKVYLDNFVSRMKGVSHTRYSLFKKMISTADKICLIAEIKKASPSKGLIRENFNAIEIAKAYIESGADAISILTEEKYFLGDPQYVARVSYKLEVPVLAKDFFLQEGQLYEAKVHGASAVLLIVAILDQDTLEDLLGKAQALDLDCLVEIHSEAELEQALQAGAEIIGVNNRDLNTFKVDLKTCADLIPKIPKDKVIVAESGISSNADVQTMKALGANAVLIGETFMKSKDIAAKVKEVMGFPLKGDLK